MSLLEGLKRKMRLSRYIMDKNCLNIEKNNNVTLVNAKPNGACYWIPPRAHIFP